MIMKKLGAVILVLSFFGVLLVTQAFRGQRPVLVEAITLLGSPVRNTEGADVGKIEQLLINPDDGQIAYAVVAVGGTLGFSETSIAIPWDAVKVARDKEAVVLTVKREVLEKAPRVAERTDFDITGRGTDPQIKNQSP
ncbi:MAG: PRC-barrel domain-containing protein [Nitrospiraceae bacterium]